MRFGLDGQFRTFRKGDVLKNCGMYCFDTRDNDSEARGVSALSGKLWML